MFRIRMMTLCVVFLALILALPTALSAQDVQPTIMISLPAEGEVVSATSVTVNGTATALPENTVVVQAVSIDGAIFGQEIATVNAEAGGSGDWQVALQLRTAPGTPGQIVAFATSPESGTPIASAAVNVVFGAAPDEPAAPTTEPQPELPIAPTQEPEPELPVEPTEEPEPELPVAPTEEPEPELPIAPTVEPDAATIKIRIPQEGEVVSPVEIVLVGDGEGLPENNVAVRAVTDAGDTVGQGTATVDAPLGQAGEWRTSIFVNVEPGTTGRIVALAPSPADGTIVAQDSIQVTYGQAVPEITPTPTPLPPVDASLTIEIPLDGEVVSPNEVVVLGTGVGLPENNVVVRAVDDRDNVLDEQVATVDADLGQEGEWRVTLKPDVASGVRGRILAFSPSPADGSDVAQASIRVQYGEAALPGKPLINIDQPAPDTYVNTDGSFVAGGVAFGTFENNVIVEVFDADGVRRTRQATTAGSDGRWSATLTPGQIVGRGSILAYSTSPADGRVEAEDKVGANFVATVTPLRPSIRIDTPRDGARVDAGGFVVSGAATNVFENNVIVRLRDSFGRTLRQTVTTADAGGVWSVSFQVLVEDGTPGSVYAFSTSPADGTIVADDITQIVFASSCKLRTDWPIYVVSAGDTLFSVAQRTGSSVGELMVGNCLTDPNLIFAGQQLYVPHLPGPATPPALTPDISVEEPAADENILLYDPLRVTGTATGTLPGSLFVRLLNARGDVLDETRGRVIETTPDEQVWQWEAELETYKAFTGARGLIVAYAISIADGSPQRIAQVPVIFGATQDRPYILIESPSAYASVDLGETFVVSGRGGALFENNVVVKLLDRAGNTVIEEPTTMMSSELGGEGTWQIELPVEYVGRGRIVAYSPSPVDGAADAEAGIDIMFGDPTEEDAYVAISYPLPGSLVTNDHEYYALAGYAGDALISSVMILVQDALGNILYLLPADVDEDSSFWSTSIKLNQEIMQDQDISVNVLAPSSLDGAVLAGDRIGVQARADPAYVTGEVTDLQGDPLPPPAVVRVQLLDISRADAPSIVVGEQVIRRPGQGPVPFAVAYNLDDIDLRFSYAIEATIRDTDGTLLHRNTTATPVITGNHPDSGVEVIVEPVP